MIAKDSDPVPVVSAHADRSIHTMGAVENLPGARKEDEPFDFKTILPTNPLDGITCLIWKGWQVLLLAVKRERRLLRVVNALTSIDQTVSVARAFIWEG